MRLNLLKKVLIAIVFTFIVGHINISAQENINDTIFESVEQMPIFEGGNDNINKWIVQNLVYPQEINAKGIEGRIIVRFVVCNDGTTKDATILKGIDPTIDKEVIKMISLMPKWTPGTIDGQPVNVYFTLPVTFKKQTTESEQQAVNNTTETDEGSIKQFKKIYLIQRDDKKYIASLELDIPPMSASYVEKRISEKLFDREESLEKAMVSSLSKAIIKDLTGKSFSQTKIADGIIKYNAHCSSWIPGDIISYSYSMIETLFNKSNLTNSSTSTTKVKEVTGSITYDIKNGRNIVLQDIFTPEAISLFKLDDDTEPLSIIIIIDDEMFIINTDENKNESNIEMLYFRAFHLALGELTRLKRSVVLTNNMASIKSIKKYMVIHSPILKLQNHPNCFTDMFKGFFQY